jgi:hypothetical protein
MLDTKGTFDALVVKHAGGPEQAERILANRFYRNISGALSGTQEYMAMEKLYELHDESGLRPRGRRHAAHPQRARLPRRAPRLTRFLDHRLYRLILAPTRAYLKAVNVAAQAFLRTVGRRWSAPTSSATPSRSSRPSTAWRRASGRGPAGDGAADGARDLVRAGGLRPARHRRGGVLLRRQAAHRRHPVGALVVNRLHPRYGDADGQQPLPDAPRPPVRRSRCSWRTWPSFRLIGARARSTSSLPLLTAAVGDAPVVRVPFLSTDVHDLTR